MTARPGRAGAALALAADTLVEGVHFPEGTAPEDVAWKVLAVNASDLAAMGAEPVAAHVSAHAPRPEWLRRFERGLDDPARTLGLPVETLRLGDGPTETTATVIGRVPHGKALRRAGARVDDDVWVTGTLGDAGLALRAARDGRRLDAGHRRWLRERLDRPMPRLGAGRALRALASAAIDVSDGLAQDLGHLLAASGVGARVEVERLPRSAALDACASAAEARELALAAGDDYELCFTASPGHAAAVGKALEGLGCPARRVGRIVGTAGLVLVDAAGAPVPVPPGYEHFRAAEADR